MKNFISKLFFDLGRLKLLTIIFLVNFSYAAESADDSNPLLVLDPGLFVWTILSFLLLMFILSKFAWKPLLKMLNEREEKIRTAIEKAENAEKKLETLNEQGEKILSDARSESQKLLLSTKETAQNLKEEIEREAKQKATSIIDQARVQIQAEKNQVLSEIKNELSSFSIMIAEKLIKKNINKDDNMKLINESIEKVNKINEA
ncbi:MAG: ATP synthase F0 subunit B [Candidatus Marinimicrobia bacterium]|nr:ATP synthase F0 subunit B [Candidatus Neomarinimicrobiota bacterium]OUW50191.1 MAG: ATP synthase F0 subunit B [bacterium TMED190]|tara:strand:+ start:1432 stop:2040 length:609 start_codon:yes stop_codon:yes gene_type:complete